MRKISRVMLTALFLLLLSGCHGKGKSVEFVTPDEFDEARNYEITFWAKNDTNQAQADVYKKAIEDFNKQYPNIKVNLKLYTDYSKIYNDVITNISTGTTPNVCITYPDHIATYMTGDNVVVPLDDLMDDDNYGFGGTKVNFDSPKKDEVIERFLNEGILKGHQYAIPYMRSTEVLYINKDFVEKLGYEVPDIVTWDFIWEVSEKALEKDAKGNYILNGGSVMIPFIYKSTDNMMISMLNQLGAPYSNENGEILIFNEETRKILFEVSKHAKSGAFSTFKISSYPANFLNAGQCVFAIDSTAGATWMGSNAPLVDIAEEDLVDFETVVRPIPQYDENNIRMISQGPSICIFNKEDPQVVLASWLFAQFLLTNDVQIGYAMTEGYAPVTYKARETAEYKEYLNKEGSDNNLYYDIKIKATKLLLESTDMTFTTPVFNGSASLRTAAGELIEIATKSARRKKTVDDAFIDKSFDDVTSLYRLDQISAQGDAKKELGKLPKEAKLLIITLIIVWILIGIVVSFDYAKKKRNS